jgi:hypothetical protein
LVSDGSDDVRYQQSAAQQALSTAQQPLKAARLAEANANAATEEANRMYQRELRK